MQVRAGYRAPEVSNARWCRRQWRSERRKKWQLQARPLHQGGGCHPLVATRGYSYAPRAEKAPLMTTETTAQHQAGNQDGTNFRLTESKENRARAMNKADVCRQLHNAAEFHLFGAGSWPADRESAGAFWKLLDDFGLTASVPDEPGTTPRTNGAFGR